jgi:pimeloyl-ACP methyl ester carboxylesterase
VALTAAVLPAAAQGQCETRSTATVRLVTVAPSIALEVLDWGGSGPALVFLPGFGNTAHVYTEFAPRFTARHRVLGITRLGFGASSQPATGYDVPTLAAYTLAVLDSMGLDRVTLVGHSFAGNELTWIAALHPRRVRGVIYLDAGFDFKALYASWAGGESPDEPPMTAADEASATAVQAYQERISGVRTPCEEIQATLIFGPDGRLAGDRNGRHVPRQLGRGVVSARYSLIRAPVLAIYAVPRSVATFLPFVDWTDTTQARKARRNFDDWIRGTGTERERLSAALPQARVVSLVGAHHYVFLSHGDSTQALMEAFLMESLGGSSAP